MDLSQQARDNFNKENHTIMSDEQEAELTMLIATLEASVLLHDQVGDSYSLDQLLRARAAIVDFFAVNQI